MSVLDSIRRIPNHPGSVQVKRPGERPRLFLVIHTMEGAEGARTAEDTALWLSRGGPGSPAGVHFCIDRDSIVQMAETKDVCAGAGGIIPGHRGANWYSVHIELAGRANQTPEQWADAASVATLQNCALLCGRILVPKLQTPVKHLTPVEIRALTPGFCGHIDITNACRKVGGHWDPGPNFPWGRFLSMVREAME